MKCLDSILGPVSPPLLALVLALAGCSDDGLAPPADTDAVSTGGSGSDPTGVATGSATTVSEDGTGGSGTGGTGGSSTGPGDTGGSGTTGESPPNTCEVPRDCVLVNDCCQCAAAHVDDVVPECPMECDQPMCDALGIPDIALVCEEGVCGLETHDCSGNVACDSLPPNCPPDTLPEVGPAAGGVAGCWTGECIPVAACDPVPSCEFCLPNEACVQTVTMIGASVSCQAIPEACGGTPSCACMPDACQAPFDTCADADGGLQCECPAC